ncbi:MAG TPA: MmcQ/YjbR family DNA-binding protein [Gemmatimonadales bacterium]|jgi:predicted DNA-binding protein (MmcQ/YjbR family)
MAKEARTKSVMTLAKAEKALRDAGMKFPEVTEDFPWGHRALKVKGKAFIFIALEGDELSLSVKLPSSNSVALTLPFASPTAYGLAKSGWVTARFKRSDRIPVALLSTWMEESYQAVAPKSLAAMIAGGQAVRRTGRSGRSGRTRRSGIK